jgi:uncharacterized protein (DUF1778 family)
MTKKDSHLTIRISSDELQEIKDFAISQNVSFTDFVMDAIKARMGKELGLNERLERLEKIIYERNAA